MSTTVHIAIYCKYHIAIIVHGDHIDTIIVVCVSDIFHVIHPESKYHGDLVFWVIIQPELSVSDKTNLLIIRAVTVIQLFIKNNPDLIHIIFIIDTCPVEILVDITIKVHNGYCACVICFPGILWCFSILCSGGCFRIVFCLRFFITDTIIFPDRIIIRLTIGVFCRGHIIQFNYCIIDINFLDLWNDRSYPDRILSTPDKLFVAACQIQMSHRKAVIILSFVCLHVWIDKGAFFICLVVKCRSIKLFHKVQKLGRMIIVIYNDTGIVAYGLSIRSI